MKKAVLKKYLKNRAVKPVVETKEAKPKKKAKKGE